MPPRSLGHGSAVNLATEGLRSGASCLTHDRWGFGIGAWGVLRAFDAAIAAKEVSSKVKRGHRSLMSIDRLDDPELEEDGGHQ